MKIHKQTAKNIDPFITLLSSTDSKLRRRARKILVSVGRPAVSSLSHVLENSTVYKARWEAAKALGEIGDAKAIPSLVLALEDSHSDVVWLAAEALKKFKKAAWPELLTALVQRGAESVSLRNGAHHVFCKQREDGCNDLLAALKRNLESGAVLERTPIAATALLTRMRSISAFEQPD